MDTTLKDKMLEAAKAETAAMMDEHWDEICTACSEAYAEHSSEDSKKKFKYNVGLKAILTPKAGDFKVSAAIEWGVKHKDESAGVTVSNEPELGLEEGKDELYDEAIGIIKETKRISTSSIQRRLKIGYTRAAHIMDQLEVEGVIGPPRGTDPREILIDLT